MPVTPVGWAVVVTHCVELHWRFVLDSKDEVHLVPGSVIVVDGHVGSTHARHERWGTRLPIAAKPKEEVGQPRQYSQISQQPLDSPRSRIHREGCAGAALDDADPPSHVTDLVAIAVGVNSHVLGDRPVTNFGFHPPDEVRRLGNVEVPRKRVLHSRAVVVASTAVAEFFTYCGSSWAGHYRWDRPLPDAQPQFGVAQSKSHSYFSLAANVSFSLSAITALSCCLSCALVRRLLCFFSTSGSFLKQPSTKTPRKSPAES